MSLFVGAGTVLNVVAVLVGGGIGLLLGSRLPERVRLVAMDALGLGTLAIGGLAVLDVTSAELSEEVGRGAVLVVLGSVLLGGIAGALLRIEGRLEDLGRVLRRLLLRRADDGPGQVGAPGQGGAPGEGGGSARFVEGFVTASLVFCVGPLTVLGSINDGLGRGIDELAVKSLLDFVAAAAFASALGSGVLLSALSVAVVQGVLTALGALLGDLLDPAQTAALSATGGLLLLGVALRLLRVREIPVGDLLPALVVAPVLVAVVGSLLR